MIVFGIKNCDKVRASIKWAKSEGHEFRLHDYREDGISQQLLTQMLADIDFSQLLNKRSTTWKALDDDEKLAADESLLLAYPTLIKRPVIKINQHYYLGFEPELWKQKY